MANPRGSKPDKLMRDAIVLELKREAIDADGKPTRKLDLVAAKLVAIAMEGDMQAIKEINDRADGKVPQAVIGDADEDPIMVSAIVRTLVRP